MQRVGGVSQDVLRLLEATHLEKVLGRETSMIFSEPYHCGVIS